MIFVCMGYADESKLRAMPKEELEAAIERCFAYDDELRRGGHFAGGYALQGAAVTLSRRGGKTSVTDGPFVETKEQIGGILLLEAKDLNQAIALMERHPGLEMGPFEIRPLDHEFMKLIEARGEAFAGNAK